MSSISVSSSAPADTADDASVRRSGLVALCFYALVVGMVTSVGAFVLRSLMALFHNAFFLGKFSFIYDANVFDASAPWGPWIILAPVIGGLVVVWLVETFAPEARGHGVPEVMDAIYYKGGRVRMAVIFIKSLASALVDRLRRLGRPRGPDHPDRQRHRLDARPRLPPADLADHHAGRCRRRRRHRRHLQHAARRGDVRARADAAGSVLAHLPAGGDRDRRGHLFRLAVLRLPAGLPGAGDRPARNRRSPTRSASCRSTSSSACCAASPRRLSCGSWPGWRNCSRRRSRATPTPATSSA